MVQCDHVCAGTVKFPKSWFWTVLSRQKVQHLFFSYTWSAHLKYLPKGCPYMLMYSALHIMQWFFDCFIDVFTQKIAQKFFNFYILWIKTNVAYTILEVIARTLYCTSVIVYHWCQTDLLLCTVKCFIQWAHSPNMAVGDLDFYYTLYLWRYYIIKMLSWAILIRMRIN